MLFILSLFRDCRFKQIHYFQILSSFTHWKSQSKLLRWFEETSGHVVPDRVISGHLQPTNVQGSGAQAPGVLAGPGPIQRGITVNLFDPRLQAQGHEI